MIYVDDVFIRTAPGELGMRWGATWCHMTADTISELHDFAQRLGLKFEWFQNKPNGHWHYDVTKTVRARAVLAGAREIGHELEDFERVWHRPGREGVTDRASGSFVPVPRSRDGSGPAPASGTSR